MSVLNVIKVPISTNERTRLACKWVYTVLCLYFLGDCAQQMQPIEVDGVTCFGIDCLCRMLGLVFCVIIVSMYYSKICFSSINVAQTRGEGRGG